MMFTHFGITGPLVLSASSYLKKANGVNAYLDLKPALTIEQLDKRLLREFDENKITSIMCCLQKWQIF